LDDIATRKGIVGRYSASESSTYIRLVGDVDTEYIQVTHQFTGSHGLIFELEDDITIGEHGFEYAKIRSLDVGEHTNIDPLTISIVTPQPSGHKYVINEYKAIGGRDDESDDLFRKRIKGTVNVLATDSISKLTQNFQKINSNILRVFYNGVNSDGKSIISIITQNGIDLSQAELDTLLSEGEKFFSFIDIRLYGYESFGISLENAQVQPIDVDFRGELYQDYNVDDVRKEIQIKFSKYVDFRFWDYGKRVEWDDLLQIVKGQPGMKYVSDSSFIPNQDITIPVNKIPRFRGFIMRDLNGNIISNVSGTLNPIFYTN